MNDNFRKTSITDDAEKRLSDGVIAIARNNGIPLPYLEPRDESVKVPLVAYNRGQREVIGRATVGIDGKVEAVIDEPAKSYLAELIRKNIAMDLSLQFSIPAMPVDSEGKIRFHKPY